MINEWKRKHKVVYRVTLDADYYYRRITVGEYLDILTYCDNPVELEDAVVSTALLQPAIDYDTSPAGVIESLSHYILVSSKLESKDEDTDVSVEWDTIVDRCTNDITPRRNSDGEVVIPQPLILLALKPCTVFPYKPEDMLSLPMEELLQRVAWADYIMPTEQPKVVKSDPKNIKKRQYTEDELRDLAMEANTASSNKLMQEMRRHREQS